MTGPGGLNDLDSRPDWNDAEEISAGRAPRRRSMPGLNRAAVTAAAVATGIVVAVAAFNVAPAPHRAAVHVAAARHVVVCNLYVSNAAMVGANAAGIAPTTSGFCPAGPDGGGS